MNMTEAEYQLHKLTECSICLQTFTDPRMLPCIHTFCLDCLKETSDTATKKPRGNMACPLCGYFFIIPPDGLDGLQKNFFIEHLLDVTTSLQLSNVSAIACDVCKYLYGDDEKTKTATMRCLECKNNFCDICAKAHNLHQASKIHHIVNIGSESAEDLRGISLKRHCSDHNQKPLDYYCPECMKIVCVSCVIENHGAHNCKYVSTVEEELRQTIERNTLKISVYADEMLSKRKAVEDKKQNILSKFAETENEIRQRNLELKEMIDSDTSTLLEELSVKKEKQIKDCENEKKEIERIHLVLKSFETYCTQLITKGSASDICSCVKETITRADELEKDQEAFIGCPCQSTDISFTATGLLGLLNTSHSNILGQIQEVNLQVENCVIITGLHDGQNVMKDVFKIKLHRPNEIFHEQEIPTTMQNGAAAEFYLNTMYITGVGVNFDEIWDYNLASGWMKCASLVQGRSRHCAAFLDEVLYICGGYVRSDERVLDSVEAYNAVTNKCSGVGKLVHCVDSSGNCVPFGRLLYIFGGCDKDNNTMNHVQVYDTKLNTCTLLSKPMPSPCSLMRAALWHTSVVLLGIHTCFIFNFETKTWQERKHLKADVTYFGLVLENERLFVIGGGTSEKDKDGKLTWTCTDAIKFVPLQSVINDKPIEWKNCAKLPKPVLVQTYGKK